MQYSLAYIRSLNIKAGLFQIIQFNINTQFKG